MREMKFLCGAFPLWTSSLNWLMRKRYPNWINCICCLQSNENIGRCTQFIYMKRFVYFCNCSSWWKKSTYDLALLNFTKLVNITESVCVTKWALNYLIEILREREELGYIHIYLQAKHYDGCCDCDTSSYSHSLHRNYTKEDDQYDRHYIWFK